MPLRQRDHTNVIHLDYVLIRELQFIKITMEAKHDGM